MARGPPIYLLFFFNDTATTEIYTLSLHDALPIWRRWHSRECLERAWHPGTARRNWSASPRRDTARWNKSTGCCGKDRKSTRLNSSHLVISYAVFCLKKKK